MVLDVKRAFLYGKARRDIYIKLPPEDPMYGTGVVGKLERSLYGTRDAPQIWQDELKSSMEELGFRSCLSNPGVYIQDETGVLAVAHVDDVLAVGSSCHLQNFQAQLHKKYDLKHHILGPSVSEEQEVEFGPHYSMDQGWLGI